MLVSSKPYAPAALSPDMELIPDPNITIFHRDSYLAQGSKMCGIDSSIFVHHFSFGSGRFAGDDELGEFCR
jgi:hypothetical protein